jgi:two-component system, sensor histidine kinase YesM
MNKRFIKEFFIRHRIFTIRKKMLTSYFVLIFSPLIAITIVSYKNVSKGYQEQIEYSANQSFDQAKRYLEYKINSLIKTSDIVYYDNNVQSILEKGQREDYLNDIVEQNIDMIKLDNFLYTFRDTQDIFRVSLYVNDGLMYSNQDINFSNLRGIKDSGIYSKVMDSKDKVYWLPPEEVRNEGNSNLKLNVISLLRKIKNLNRYGEILGIVKVSILESQVKDIMLKANITKNGVVYIQNSEGEVISSSNPEALERININKKTRDELVNNTISWSSMNINNEKYIVNSKGINNTDWNMVTVIPYSEILAPSNKIRDLMMSLVLIIGVITYAVAYINSNSLTKRISLLSRKMKKVQLGELDVSIYSKSNDEIGTLMNSFNYMIEKINDLVEEKYKIGKEIKNAELKALQAQINPHFLYNTLDLINWKAIDNNVPEIAETAQALAKFYKLSLSKGKDIISIEDEIKHVATYVQIQNLRFDNRIKLIVDVDEAIYQYYIMKILLQPIVENSIIHGILETRDDQDGTIILKGIIDIDIIILTIEDNGVGMGHNEIKDLFINNISLTGNGYGVRNINDRIKLVYGKDYGLTYSSILGKGTKVEIRIPALKKEEY